MLRPCTHGKKKFKVNRHDTRMSKLSSLSCFKICARAMWQAVARGILRNKRSEEVRKTSTQTNLIESL